MITIRKSKQRGHANHGWLDTYHTFSFADYFDPKYMGFRSLRVINEDRVAPANGFGTHGHNDMEIITYVMEGALEHKDSMGNIGVIRPGDVQRMSAGTGVRHSEYNHSKTDPVHLLQIWIMPASRGISPSYEQIAFSAEERSGKLKQIAVSDAAKNGNGGAVKIHQDASIFASILKPGETTQHELAAGRYGWLQVAKGSVELNGQKLEAGDGAAIENETKLSITGKDSTSEVLLFDLA
ncbi:MAG: Pirin domain protein [Acidobacteriales bacterium]|nr:Pirin domain protein [Terriglobales bacterium]